MIKFSNQNLRELWKPENSSKKGDNGKVTIIGGSKLFHGAPILAIQTASRLVDMVYFSSPEPDLEKISAKSFLKAFIWVPWEEIEHYVAKSDAVLIGPGMMRYESGRVEDQESICKEFDNEGTLTRSITKYFLQKYSDKQWVIDGGSLQVMETDWIPKGAVLTTNEKEFELLFGCGFSVDSFQSVARLNSCIIVHKGVATYVTDGEITYEIIGGNAGLTKGGTGDIQAGLTVGLLAKNPPILAAAAASLVIKMTAEELYKRVGFNYNADDAANKVFEVMETLS